jgi:UDP-N-acetylglucosamine--N-acetylmuramyl-(pentapeptide) pyrophosphoryl-undecaprenol N-acetylglucosamine transferase
MLCRSGAGTITELQNVGLPAIFIPYPFATDDHQYYNAKEMEAHGAAEIILDKELTGEKIAQRLLFYSQNPDRLENMRQASSKLAKPQAAKAVVDHCLAMAQARSIVTYGTKEHN